MEKIIVGGKDPKDTEDYQDLFSFLIKTLKLVEKKMLIFLKYSKTGESLQYHNIHFRREYVPQLIDSFCKNDIASIAKIPHEKDDCAFRLEARYVKSGQMIGLQIVEARTGVNGGYFFTTPAIVYLDEEAEKVYNLLKPLL